MATRGKRQGNGEVQAQDASEWLVVQAPGENGPKQDRPGTSSRKKPRRTVAKGGEKRRSRRLWRSDESQSQESLDARLARTEEIVEAQSAEIDAMQEQIEKLDAKVRTLRTKPRQAGSSKAGRKKRPAARSGAKNGDKTDG